MSRGFGSDNHSGAHPEIMRAISDANHNHAPSYGTDEQTQKANQLMRKLFGEKTLTYFVFNGTAANVIALASVVRSTHAILASQHAHIINDECGAPEKSLGCKIISVPSRDGKVTPETLKPHLIRRGDQHYSQVRAVSITQPTELGALYTVEEIRAISNFCRENQLCLHMDGSRLVNAVEALGVSFEEMTTKAGVDVLSLGGTKNGLLFGEAVLLLQPERTFGGEEIKYVRKQLMQLPSKTRFVAAQFETFLGTNLWQTNARNANAMAKRLYKGLSKIGSAKLTQVTEANTVFVELPKSWIAPLRKASFFYVWNEHSFECRFVTSWDTTEKDVDDFLSVMQALELEPPVSNAN